MKKPLSDSPTFCPAPWTQIALNTDAEPRPCCAIYNSLGRYKDLPEYWNSKPLQEIRNAMLQGKWHPACSSCEKTEKHGGISKRHYEQYLLHEVLSDPDFVYDIDVSERGHVDVRMTLTSPNCPAAQVLPGEVEIKSGSVENVSSVAVDVVWDPPWEPSMMSEAAQLELNMF